jgi:DNA-binding XRE family transcriptional regulator
MRGVSAASGQQESRGTRPWPATSCFLEATAILPVLWGQAFLAHRQTLSNPTTRRFVSRLRFRPKRYSPNIEFLDNGTNNLIFCLVAKRSYDGERQFLRTLLRQLREEAHLCQADIARELGHPQSFVSNYEAGQRLLDLSELHHICEVVGVPLSELSARFEAFCSTDRPPDYRKRRRVDRKAN